MAWPQIRMPNDKRMTKLKARPSTQARLFVIRISDFFRHSSFVIRHSVLWPESCSLNPPMTACPVCKRNILVVDDEPLVCETVTMLLQIDGHRVASAHSATEALAL